jgi:hypothetical protein
MKRLPTDEERAILNEFKQRTKDKIKKNKSLVSNELIKDFGT